MRKRLQIFCLLLLPCLTLMGILGRGSPAALSASSDAAIPASADNWGLSFPAEHETPIGNATADFLTQYDAWYVGDTSQKVIYLTFDCGYENGHTAAILDALKKHHAPAAFFVVGHMVESAPDIVRRMAEEGHIVGNHTYHHPDMSAIADESSFRQELEEMIRLLQNCPCIVLWVPFNEGWGQFDAKQITRLVRKLDPTRLIDHASGWHDQGVSDVRSLHVYFKPYRFRPDKKGRAVVLSEFGGYNLPVAGHTWNEKNFGYKGYQTPEALGEAVRKLYETQIIPARKAGLAADVYTQLSDVEDECNGFVTETQIKEMKFFREKLLETLSDPKVAAMRKTDREYFSENVTGKNTYDPEFIRRAVENILNSK